MKGTVAAETAFREYWELYGLRETAGVIGLFSDTSTIVGTGSDEVRLNRKASEQQIFRDFSQAEEPIEVSIGEMTLQAISEAVVLIITTVDLKTTVNNMKFEYRGLRCSTLMVKVEDQWKMEHMHLSNHDPDFNQGESWPLQKLEEERLALASALEDRTTELAEAREKVKVLSGLLPICAQCKRIRNRGGEWEVLELYINKRSEAEFTHAICTTCFDQHFEP